MSLGAVLPIPLAYGKRGDYNMGKKTPPLSPEERNRAASDFYGKKPQHRRNYPVADQAQREQDAIDKAMEESVKDEAARQKAAKEADRKETAEVNAKFQNALKKAREMKKQKNKNPQLTDSTRAVAGEDFGETRREIHDNNHGRRGRHADMVTKDRGQDSPDMRR